MGNYPLISVIITTKNEESVIGQLLDSLRRQTEKRFEIIIVDNYSSDRTREIAKRYTKRIFLKGPERSSQRNFGASKAGGRYLLFLDADMVLGPDVLAQCLAAVKKNKRIKAVVIPEKSAGNSFWAKCKTLERACYVGDGTIEAARFFDTHAFVEAGGYDDRLTGPEDWDLPQKVKAKHAIGRIASFIMHNERNITLAGLAKKKYYYGLKVARYVSQHPLSITGQQLVYLLRPAFYRNWKLLVSHPVLTLGMIMMLAVEQCAGFAGFVKGKRS